MTPLGPRHKTYRHQANMSVPVSPKGIAIKSNDYSIRNFAKMSKKENNANHDSIYTIGDPE